VSFSAFNGSIIPLARVGYKNVPDSKTAVLRTKFPLPIECEARHGGTRPARRHLFCWTLARGLLYQIPAPLAQNKRVLSGQAHLNSIQRLPTNRNDETNAPLSKKVFRNGWMTLLIVRDFSAVKLNLDALALIHRIRSGANPCPIRYNRNNNARCRTHSQRMPAAYLFALTFASAVPSDTVFVLPVPP